MFSYAVSKLKHHKSDNPRCFSQGVVYWTAVVEAVELRYHLCQAGYHEYRSELPSSAEVEGAPSSWPQKRSL